MVTRKSRYGWMSLGCLLCLFGLAVLCKVRDGNRAEARSGPLPPVPGETAEPPTADTPPRVLPPLGFALPALNQAKPDAGEIVPAAAVLPNTPTPPGTGTETRPILIPAGATSVNPTPPIPAPATAPFPPPMPPVAPLPAPKAAPLVPPTVEVTPPLPASPSMSAPPPGLTDPLPGVSAPSVPMPPPTKVEATREHPGEPPLAPAPGPVLTWKVKVAGETFKTLARKMLGTAERWSDIHKLNPTLKSDAPIAAGTIVRLPGDACIAEDAENVRALPLLRPRTQAKARASLPLTGTYSVTLDDAKGLTLPRAIQQQLGNCDTILVSPGSDRCLWLTNQAHLDRLQAKLDRSPARESDIRGFKRLYYAQTVKCTVKDGRVLITDKLAAFASLGAEVVLVGIDDHFEVWDAARWKRYTQTKKASTAEE